MQPVLQPIQIVAVSDGWAIDFAGETKERHPDLASAYQGALRLCAELFDLGVGTRVFQRDPARSAA